MRGDSCGDGPEGCSALRADRKRRSRALVQGHTAFGSVPNADVGCVGIRAAFGHGSDVLKEFVVILKRLAGVGFGLVLALGAIGCGQADPAANVPPEKRAPDPMQLGNDPEYVKQMGGNKKK